MYCTVLCCAEINWIVLICTDCAVLNAYPIFCVPRHMYTKVLNMWYVQLYAYNFWEARKKKKNSDATIIMAKSRSAYVDVLNMRILTYHPYPSRGRKNLRVFWRHSVLANKKGSPYEYALTNRVHVKSDWFVAPLNCAPHAGAIGAIIQLDHVHPTRRRTNKRETPIGKQPKL